MRPLTVVTGATRGLGASVAQSLARRGHRVLFTGRDESVLARHVAEMKRAGHDASACVLDVTNEGHLVRLRDLIANERVGVVVNNAGIALRGFDADVARRTIDANFYGAERVTDVVTPRLTEDARIVMVSSALGELSCLAPDLQKAFIDPSLDRTKLHALVERFVRDVSEGTHSRRGWPTSAYSVSKVALNALTRLIARELPRAHVNAVCPGWVRTDMGGKSAPRTIEEGTASIIWAATLPAGPSSPTGGFFRDGHEVDW